MRLYLINDTQVHTFRKNNQRQAKDEYLSLSTLPTAPFACMFCVKVH